MSIKSNAEAIEAGKKRAKKVKEITEQLGEEPKLTNSVKHFLTVTKLSLSSAIKKGYVTVNYTTKRYIVTKKGNRFKQKGR